MAIGDFRRFDQFKYDLGETIHDLSSHTFKAALIKSAANGGIDPTVGLADPRWGADGSTDLSASEVTEGGNYTAGGLTMVQVWTLASGNTTFKHSGTLQWLMNGSNPTNARWMIVYNFTEVGRRAVGYIDLASDIDMTVGDLEHTADPVNGLFTLT